MRILGWRMPAMSSLLIWAVLWEILGQSGLTMILPPLSAIFGRLGELAVNESFWNALALTARTYAMGAGIAILAGVPIGLLMGRIVVLDRLLLPWVNMFTSAPLSALVPVIMAIFGFGETTVVLTVVLFAVWIIVLDTRAGVLHIPRSLEEMALSYGASRLELYTKVVFWAALPEILAGIRLGVIRGVKGVVVGQLLVSIIGYGELFELYSRGFEMTYFWALTLILFAAAMLLSGLVEFFEKKIQFYAGAR